jgi:hypothetical protein
MKKSIFAAVCALTSAQVNVSTVQNGNFNNASTSVNARGGYGRGRYGAFPVGVPVGIPVRRMSSKFLRGWY